jgi:DNA-binding MarR family transcriptional regulator
MPTSTDLPAGRLAIGQLLVRLLTQFRRELLAPARDRGYADIRAAHLQIFGNLGVDGIRLTALAARSQLSLAATSELIDDLQQLGYLERRPDPSDGRAKLICPTPRGRQALNAAGDRVAEIEHHWAELAGRADFDAACRTLQHLLDATTGQTPPPSQPPLSPGP